MSRGRWGSLRRPFPWVSGHRAPSQLPATLPCVLLGRLFPGRAARLSAELSRTCLEILAVSLSWPLNILSYKDVAQVLYLSRQL